ncbi:hypothetical protein Bca52824_089455 [Brassica carinata]|uniref:Uncharacterized protein n=1 Tax=Brassica carinata TaxID=52824 RepID=A0A8X7TPT2_BRACI|nr:hypothetical protein Bca52824_089455 [Brassica carinata]
MDPPKEGSGETGITPSGVQLLKVKQEVDIEDPPKLPGKLTRALYRKLQQTPCTWGTYTASRVGAARFPSLYGVTFDNPVAVTELEVSEGNSVVSISTEASTSETEKTQAMPLQPSFRSRGRQTRTASASQGGAFLDSVKERMLRLREVNQLMLIRKVESLRLS